MLQDVILKEHRQRLENAVEMAAKLQRNEETLLRGKMDSVSCCCLHEYPEHILFMVACACAAVGPKQRVRALIVSCCKQCHSLTHMTL